MRMTGKEIRLINEMANTIISFLNYLNKENEKTDCIFRNTPMCNGIKLCSSCSMRIEEGEENDE